MVTCAFLLITAVWVTNFSIDVNANVPDKLDEVVDPKPPEKTLHVYLGQDEFTLAWKTGATVHSETKVPKERTEGDLVRFPELAKRIAAEWEANGGHKAAHDTALDQAVLHTDARVPYKEIAAVMDAVHATKRRMQAGEKLAMVPAMNMTFSAR